MCGCDGEETTVADRVTEKHLQGSKLLRVTHAGCGMEVWVNRKDAKNGYVLLWFWEEACQVLADPQARQLFEDILRAFGSAVHQRAAGLTTPARQRYLRELQAIRDHLQQLTENG